MARPIPSPAPTPRNSRANMSTEPSAAASGIICRRRRPRPLHKPSSTPPKCRSGNGRSPSTYVAAATMKRIWTGEERSRGAASRGALASEISDRKRLCCFGQPRPIDDRGYSGGLETGPEASGRSVKNCPRQASKAQLFKSTRNSCIHDEAITTRKAVRRYRPAYGRSPEDFDRRRIPESEPRRVATGSFNGRVPGRDLGQPADGSAQSCRPCGRVRATTVPAFYA
jgi:hypothetical protein